MKRLRLLTRAAVGLALVGLVVPEQLVRAQGPTAPATTQRLPDVPQSAPAVTTAPSVGDVALGTGGLFSGQVVDAQGQPQAGALIAVYQQQRVVATTIADQQGQFEVQGLQGGMYQVTTGSNMKNYRLWASETAPPTAQRSALLVSGTDVVRGQGKGFRYWLTNPWVLAVGVATAIAVPIALSNRSKAPSS